MFKIFLIFFFFLIHSNFSFSKGLIVNGNEKLSFSDIQSLTEIDLSQSSFDTSEILFRKFYLFIEKYHKSKFILKNFKLMEEKLLTLNKKKDKKILKTMIMTVCDYNI